MAQCSSIAASLHRWMSGTCRCRCSSPLPPFRAALPRCRRATRNLRTGCASVPRELAETELPPPVVVDGTEEEAVVACEECDGTGWMVCDFCKGKKNNVQPEGSTRVYRRCPTCKAAGFILCPRCRMFKCITFPESNES